MVVPAPCQGPQVNKVTGVPDHILYNSFFFRVAWLADRADQLASQGKKDAFIRTAIRRQARLTNEEDAALTAIALDWRTQDAAVASTQRLLLKSGVQAGLSQQLQGLASQRQQLVLDHISQLQAALGPAQFFLLDLFVRRNSTVRPGENTLP